MPTCGTLHITEAAPDWTADAVQIDDCEFSVSQLREGESVEFGAWVSNDNTVDVDVHVQWFGDGTKIEGAIETVRAETVSKVDTGPKTYNQLATQYGEGMDVEITAQIKEVFPGGTY